MIGTPLQRIKNFLKPMSLGLLQLTHRLMYPLMILVIGYALLVSLFTALTPWVKTYKSQITTILSQSAHQRIEIEDIKTSWYGWYPVLKLMHVQFYPKDGKVLVCHECWIGFDVIRSLLYWHLHPGMLYIDGLDLNLIQKKDHWEIQGAKSITTANNNQTDPARVLAKILSFAPERVLLKNIQLTFHPLSHKIYAFKNIRLLGVKQTGNYHWSLQSSFGKDSLLKLRIDMPLLSNLALPQNGNMYMELQKLDLSTIPGYKNFLQDKQFKQLNGILNGQAWLDWNQGHIDMIHSQLNWQQGIIQTSVAAKPLLFDNFQANSVWKKRKSGWQLAMDKITLQSKELGLHEDKFLWFYQSDWNTHHVYLKLFPLTFLKSIQFQFPSMDLKALPIFPQGELKELQLNIKDGQVDYFLSQFNDISWEAFKNYPAVSGLSGGVTWEPNQSHIEIASQNFMLKPKNHAPIVFDNLQTSLSLQKSLTGSQKLYVEKLIVSRKDLALTASGQIDDPWSGLNRNLILQMNWSAENAHKWLKYIHLILPSSNLLKWLENDIKVIKKTSGSMILNGLWRDFPFNQHQGEFVINSYLYGVDLYFAKGWPISTDVDANLKVNQNTLQVAIDKGFLGNIPISQLQLSAPHLGLGKEVLLVHGLLYHPIQQIYQYLLKTPLKEQAKNWLIYDFKGNGTLDLKLDIPLYKGRDEVFVDGTLKFDEQAVDLNLFTKSLSINHCKGFINFNGHGLYGGQLAGRLGADPFLLNIEHQPQAQETLLYIQGALGVDELTKAWNIPDNRWMTGHLPIEGVIHLPNRQQKNLEMQWKSNLKGVVIDLPSPWNKAEKEEKPLDMDMIYHQDGLLNIDVLYEHKNWKIDYDKKQWHLAIAEPELMGDIYYHLAQKKVEAKLSRLYLEDQFLKSKTPEKNAWNIEELPDLKIQVEDFHYNHLNLGVLNLSAGKNSKKYVLDELTITSPGYHILVHGDWLQRHLKNHIQFAGQMNVSHLSKLLSQWGITPVADTRNGLIEFTGQWDEPLNQVSLKTLKGALDIQLKKGNISHFDAQTEKKIGLGKLLSILSLQTLPRRLQLDFSDLSTEGLAYDIFKGHFDLNQGLLHTEDTILDGPIAHVKMHGDLNVLDQWYDLELQVYPYITASLPVVATIAGGPLAGVATWAANHVINKGMQQISGYTYKITGPWREPVVQQVNLMRKKNDNAVKTND